MFGSVALDVFIGMVLIYLLYSLLVSIIGEMLATWMGIRARFLRKAIENMLNDDLGDSEKLRPMGKQAGRFFLYEFSSFKNSFAGRFYNHPSIKYLAQSEKKKPSFRNGKPSYISKENFADTLIHMLRNKGIGGDDAKRTVFCLKHNTHFIQPKTLSHLQNLMDDAGNDLTKFREKLEKWFDDTMDRTNGWYKRKLQLILFWLGFLLAVSFNVDSIKIARQLSQDKEAREQMVQLGIHETEAGSMAEKKISEINDTTATRSDTLLRKSFNEVYKATENANKILGLGWQFDTLTRKKTVCRTLYPVTYDSLKYQLLDPMCRLSAQKKCLAIRASLAKTPTEKKSYTEKACELDRKINSYLQRLNQFLETRFTALESVRTTPDTANRLVVARFYGKKHYAAADKVFFVIRNSVPWQMSFWGFVITALMISLGAPFWFDLLKKLVALRGAGVKPEEKEENQRKKKSRNDTDLTVSGSTAGGTTAPGAAKIAVSQTPETPVTAALRIYQDTIEMEKGVVAVGTGYLKTPKGKDPCIQVQVEDQAAAARIRSKYDRLRTGSRSFLPVRVIVTGKPSLLTGGSATGMVEKGIGNNDNYPEGMGTFSCLVREKSVPGKTYLMTCYHVVNRDKNWNGYPAKSKVVNYRGKVIASGYQGYLTAHLDTALAEVGKEEIQFYKSIAGARYPAGVNQVSEDDVMSTSVFINGFSTRESSGTIVNLNWSQPFSYNKDLFRLEGLIVLSREDPGGNEVSLSTFGDSGSLVLDEQNHALGVIFAGDLVHSYAIPMTTILGELDLELVL